MADVWVIGDYDEKGLRKTSLNAIGAGKAVAEKAGGACVGVVIGKGCGDAAEKMSKYGIKVLAMEVDGDYMAETFAEALAEKAKADAPSYILTAAGSMGYDLLPRLAAKLGVACLTSVSDIEPGDPAIMQRPMYAANIVAHVEMADATKCAVLRPPSFAEAEEADGGSVENVSVSLPSFDKKKVVSREIKKSDKIQLTEAERVVSGGRGLKNAENFDTVLAPLCDTLGAAMGATRAVVDAGFVPNDMQVGQTGKTVSPVLYIAAGISGALQHTAGMKDSKCIVAINKDPDAPIFQVADYGIVDDLFKVVPELDKRLKEVL